MANIWKTLPRPIVGLSAMDGVTDAAMRHITKKYGNPDFMVTEFTSADGIVHGVTKLLRDFYYTDISQPIIAQIFGTNPDKFRICAAVCCFLGFEGIDINMGCPADSVVHKGGGATLIKNPRLAKELISAVQQGVKEYVGGVKLNELGLESEFVARLEKFIAARKKNDEEQEREEIPISVKTRVGYDKPVTEEWVKHLLETGIDLITLHGRTLEQHYSGLASWEEIAKGARLAHEAGVMLFGNGDLNSAESIKEHIETYGVDGVWVARAAMGNPWIFAQYKEYVKTGKTPEPISTEERFRVALEHARKFEEINREVFVEEPLPFLNMRKHLGWYVKGMTKATELRAKLYQTNSSQEVEKLFSEYKEEEESV